MTKSYEELSAENEELRRSLAESNEVLRAIRSGEVDALVVSGSEGDQVFTIEGADRAYRVFIEAMNDGAVTMTLDGTILYCSRRFAEMVKSPLEKVIGTSLYHFIPQADQAAFRAIQQDLGRGELTIRAEDESILPVYISINSFQLSETQEDFCVVVTDLTEQKHRDEIVAAEKLARSIIEQTTEAVAVCNELGKIIRFSNGLSKILGCDPSLQSFDDLFDLRLPIGGKISPVSVALHGEVLLKIEASFERSDGMLFHLLLNAGPLKSAEGKIIGCVVTLTDVTEHKQAEIALQESEQRYATTLASIGDAVIATDIAGRITFMNHVAEELTGWTLHEAMMKLAKEVFNIINEFTRQKVEDPIDRVLGDGAIVGLANHTILIRRDGTEVAVDDIGTPIRNRIGDITGVVLIFRDITERRRMEEALRESEENYRTIVETANEGIWVVDPETRTTYVNRRMAEMLGYSSEEMIGKKSSEFMDEEDKARLELMLERRRQGINESFEIKFFRKDGSLLWAISSAAPLRDKDGKFVGSLGMLTDITDRKRMDEMLRRSEEKYRTAIDFTCDWETWLSPEGNYIYVSPSCEGITGYSADKFLTDP